MSHTKGKKNDRFSLRLIPADITNVPELSVANLCLSSSLKKYVLSQHFFSKSWFKDSDSFYSMDEPLSYAVSKIIWGIVLILGTFWVHFKWVSLEFVYNIFQTYSMG